MKHLLIAAIIGFILQGCENAPVRRQDMIAAHPEWDAQMVKLVRGGYLAKGMTQDQVRAAWGRPCWSCTGTTKGDWGSAWEYPTKVVFFDETGKVTRWEIK